MSHCRLNVSVRYITEYRATQTVFDNIIIYLTAFDFQLTPFPIMCRYQVDVSCHLNSTFSTGFNNTNNSNNLA